MTTSKLIESSHSQSTTAAASSATIIAGTATKSTPTAATSTCTFSPKNVGKVVTPPLSLSRQDSEFERYYNGQSDGINYEAAYEQLQNSDRDAATTTEGETEDDEASYRKVPIKDLINCFESQSRPVMRYKLADEQIIRKVYNREMAELKNQNLSRTQENNVETVHEEVLTTLDDQTNGTVKQQTTNQLSKCENSKNEVTYNYDFDACQEGIFTLPPSKRTPAQYLKHSPQIQTLMTFTLSFATHNY